MCDNLAGSTTGSVSKLITRRLPWTMPRYSNEGWYPLNFAQFISNMSNSVMESLHSLESSGRVAEK